MKNVDGDLVTIHIPRSKVWLIKRHFCQTTQAICDFCVFAY